MVTRIDFVHCSGHSSSCQIMLQSLYISVISAGPPVFMSSAGMPSMPGLFLSFSLLTASSISSHAMLPPSSTYSASCLASIKSIEYNYELVIVTHILTFTSSP